MEELILTQLLATHSPVAGIAAIVFWVEYQNGKKRKDMYEKLNRLEVSNAKIEARLESIDKTLKHFRKAGR